MGNHHTPAADAAGCYTFSEGDNLDEILKALDTLDTGTNTDFADRKTASPFPYVQRPQTLAERVLAARNKASGSVATLTPPIPLPNTPASTPTNNSPTTTKPVTYPHTAWRYTTPQQKFEAAYRYAQKNAGIAFTVNFSKQRLQSTCVTNDPTRHVARIFDRALKKQFGCAVPFAFAFEIDRNNKLHVHGVLILKQEAGLAEPALKARLRSALTAVGGKVTGFAAPRAVDARRLYDGAGWASYSLKDQRRIQRFLANDKTTFISQNLKAETRAFHDLNII